MIVVVKHPKMDPEVVEVEGISAINKLVGNVDDSGNGWNYANSDIREPIGHGIDQYCNAEAMWNPDLEENIWNRSDSGILCGTLVFASFDRSNKADCGASSLSEEQIEACFRYITLHKD